MKKYIRIIAVLLVITLMTSVMTACLSDVSDTESSVNTSDADVTDSSESNTPDKDDVSVENTSGSVSDDVSDDVSTPQADTPDEHTHQYGDWTTVKQATEKEEGSKKRVCDACGHEETAVIPLLSHTHSYDEWKIGGSSHWRECKCGARIANSWHNYSGITTVKKATCTADGTNSHTCVDCGYKKIFTAPATGHKYVSVITLATETEKGYTTHTCAYCGDEYVNSYTAPGFVYSEGLEYRVNEDGVSCVITGIGSCKDEIVNIPSVIDGYRVVTIDSSAFENCSQLVSVTIPDTVTNIRLFSFSGCENLDYTVYDNALYLGNCDNPYYALIIATNKQITNCEIHPETKIIAGMAFTECRDLTKISIPDKVETIGFCAFMDCTKLSEVTFGKGLKKIGGDAFERCEKITDIVIPDNVITVEDMAFAFCKSLSSVTMGDGVTYIGTNAFFFCESLKTVILGNNVKYVGEEVFTGCNKLQYNESVNAYYLGSTDNPYLVLIKLIDPSYGTPVMPNNVKIIAGGAYDGCESVNITVMDGITHIGPSAFRGCKYLKDLKLPDSLLYIGDRAFESCLYLEDVTIPDSVTYIGTQAFSCCVSLTEIVIPDSVVELGLSTFSECSGLLKATVGNGVAEIDGLMFYRCTSLTDISFGKNISRIGDSAFYECENLNNVYYEGTESDFNKINIEPANDPLSDATIHCK